MKSLTDDRKTSKHVEDQNRVHTYGQAAAAAELVSGSDSHGIILCTNREVQVKKYNLPRDLVTRADCRAYK